MRISRSENMSRIRSKHTRPEIIVRKLLREIGYPGYRLHRKDLPGSPDIAFIGRRKAILVHGCFWHAHSCKIGRRRPLSNVDYWIPKILRNQARDESNKKNLQKKGWQIFTVWECDIKELATLSKELENFMNK